MNLLRNKFVVIGLGVVALLMLLNSFRPMWQRGRSWPSTAPVKAEMPVAAPAPVQLASNAPAARASTALGEAAEAAPGIELSRVGWSIDGAPRRDPFQVTGPGGTNLTRLNPPVSEVLTLTAIWWQSGIILAEVNGNVVNEGDTVKGFRIENIGLEGIRVDGPDGREQLEFDPGFSVRGIPFKLGTGLNDSFAGAKARLQWPYRVVNGITNDVRADAGWHTLRGKVHQKLSTGRYLVSFDETDRPPFVAKGQDVIIMNVPLDLVDNDPLQTIECKLVGSEAYESLSGAKTTVRVLDYGISCSPPKETIASLKKQKAFVLQQRREAKERRIRLEMQDAEKGRASAQFMLGRRYLYGDGIAEDEDLARHWLESAAAQGNPDAQATLLVLGFQK